MKPSHDLDGAWVVDTVAYTHLARAGHLRLLQDLAPHGVIVVPDEVDYEIEAGRERYSAIPSVASLPWARLAVLTDSEDWTKLLVKAEMAGGPREHLGECAVVAVAKHRSGVAILDDRAARRQAQVHGVACLDTLWIVVEAYKVLFGRDRSRTVAVVDDLLTTGMYLPVRSGTELFAWGYQEGLLP